MTRRTSLPAALLLLATLFVGLGAWGPANADTPLSEGLLAFVAATPQPGQLFTVNPDGSDMKQVAAEDGYVGGPMWSADGTHLAFAVNELIGKIDLSDATRSWFFEAPSLVMNPAWSPDGSRFLFVPSDTFRLSVANADGTDLHALLPESFGFVRGPVWTPDGSEIVFTNTDGSSWRLNADGTNLRPFLAGQAEEVAFSPLGDRLAFGGPDVASIYVADADGTNVKQVGPGSGINHSPTFSPNGGRIAFIHAASGVAGSSRIWMMNADGSNAHQVMDREAAEVAWQPVPGTPPAPTTTTTAPANKPPTPVVSIAWGSTPRTLLVSGARSGDSDGVIASYRWNWGDGTAPAAGRLASHTYARSGNYFVRLTIVDDDGASVTHATWARVS